ncbi:MAG: ClbS/DfsB family four-helix bundle protein [Anaerolineales bacterium]|nr:ClbS/DfsB family four-helix bundle protein [Anaerolineales bacterium]
MSKPTTKNQIIEAAQTERTALEQLLTDLTLEQMTQPNVVGDWSVKDVLGHLIEWEQMVINWYKAGAKGKVPVTPSEEYNWAQLPQLNQAIYLKHRDRSLADVQKDFKASYKKIMRTILDIPEKEMFTRGHYAWIKNNILAAYFVSGTSSHYRWARTSIRKGLNSSK